MKLSVITPTRNRMGLLEGLLGSLEHQTYSDFEVLVAVDGSTDGTLALLEAYKRRGRLQLGVINLPHGGQAIARNQAIQQSRGDVLVFADDDLTLMSDVLARHAALHQVFPNSLAIAPVLYEDDTLDFPRHPSWVNFTGMNTSLPRATALEVGGFDQSLLGYGGEDLEFALRLTKKGIQIRRLPDAIAVHHGARHRNPQKGYSAGFQAVRISQKHGGNVALQLGVHPSLLGAKRLAFNPLGRALFGSRADFAFEEAYFRGARDAWKKTSS